MKLFLFVSFIATTVFLVGCGSDLTQENAFEPDTHKKFIVYDFWAVWCGPCRAYAPKFERLEAKYTRPNVTFKRINIDEDHETANLFNIHSIPTVVVVADNKEVARFSSGATESELRRALK